MTSISQIVPTYSTGGISDQPDELKKPGQVRDCVNAFPDLIGGLSKRNGLGLVKTLTNICTGGTTGRGGTWFQFTRENPASKTKENFIGKATFAGKIQVWNVETGEAVNVFTSDKEIEPNDPESIDITDLESCLVHEYLAHEVNNTLKFNTVNNFTFIANPERAVTMSKSLSKRPFESFIEVTQLAPNREYLLDIDLVDTNDTSKYSKVKTVSIVETSGFAGENKDPSCPAQFSEVLTIDEDYLVSTTKRGQQDLIIRIKSTGVQVPIKKGKKYECLYRHEVEVINGGRDWRVGDTFRVYQPGQADPPDGEGKKPEYTIEVTDTTLVRSTSELQITGVVTNADGDTILTVKDILNQLKAKISETDDFSLSDIEVVGNGVYVKSDKPFTIATSEKDLMNILSNEDEEVDNPYVTVNNVSRLPIECKDGIIAKVSNAFTDDDDYWVQFKANYGNDGESTSASGYWEEVAEPGGLVKFNSGTMPHALVYSRLSDGQTAFVFGPCNWKERTCGTDEFNPSFNDFNVNNLSFYRNRLVFLSQENLIMSRAGELFNFFPSTALTVSPLDPIDITASTDFSSVLQDCMVINNGLLVFSNYQQFLFTTDSDILNPSTAKMTEVSRYEYNTESTPFIIGTNPAFMSSSDNHSRFYEMGSIYREGTVDLVERSEIVSKSIPPNLDRITQSKETGLVLAAAYLTKDVWAYRYLKESANKDLQSAWFRWTLPENFVFHSIIDNTYYVIVENNAASCSLLKMTLDDTKGPWTDMYTDTDDGVPYEMRVDFPTINVVKKEQTNYMADTTASLVVHRIYYNFADIGSYYFDIKRNGMDDYSVLYESTFIDGYLADASPVMPEVERPIPVYTRNTSLEVSLRSSFPNPLVLYSSRWEGDYNNRYYKRV
jgi:hypothetical protein